MPGLSLSLICQLTSENMKFYIVILASSDVGLTYKGHYFSVGRLENWGGGGGGGGGGVEDILGTIFLCWETTNFEKGEGEFRRHAPALT